MKIFELDIRKLGILLLPTPFRKAKMVAWVRSLLMPLDNLYGRFIEQRQKHLYNLSINGQKCYLQKALNDEFDKEQRRIVIHEASRNTATYLHTQAENVPVYLDKSITIYTGNEYVGRLNFVVRLPLEMRVFDLKIRTLIDYYKLTSKKYELYYE